MLMTLQMNEAKRAYEQDMQLAKKLYDEVRSHFQDKYLEPVKEAFIER